MTGTTSEHQPRRRGLDLLADEQRGLLIGGAWRGADSGARFDVRDPADGSVLTDVADGSAADATAALDAAVAAQHVWARTAPRERSEILRRAFELLTGRAEDFAHLMSLEMGKTVAEAKGEVGYGAEFFRWYAEEAVRVHGRWMQAPAGGSRLLTIRKPVGPCLFITPWNFPLAMGTRKIGPAVAAGCTMVIKPAELTPLTMLALAAVMEEAGLPPGVLNVVTTSNSKELSKTLMADDRLRKVSFTGSTEVGKVLMAKAAGSVKKVSMELGGNAPFLVFDDADIDRAVEGAITAKYRNSGQTCVCTNRFFAQAGNYDAYVEKLAAASRRLKVGDGLEEGVQQGPLIDGKAVEKVEELIGDATAKGGRIVTGGHRHALGGSFFEPTVISGAAPDMRFMKEEIFGPVAPVFRFETEEEAVRLANDTEYGLACYFYTGDLGRAFRVMEGLKYGMVGVNEGLITTPEAPFGGVKESGLGREGGYQGIEDYLDTKYVCIGGLGL
jgi:succinate-semialdehyde dehydrogenase/glutarate-semialdehyde dehydrogenase